MDTQDTHFNRLREQATVTEQPFQSDAPIIGPLIVWFRSAWNSVATKWYVRPLVQQQNQINRTLVDELQQQAARAEQQAVQFAELDHSQTALLRETAVLTSQVRQLNQRLRALDARLSELEDARGE